MDTDDLAERIAELGARVNGHPEHVAEVMPQLLVMLDEHDDPRVLFGLIHAVGCAWDETANLALLRFVDHPDSQVRLAATAQLPGGTDSESGVDQVAAALIRLSRDEDVAVRDRATFGLGSILPIDTDEVRDALMERLADSSDDVVDEAIVGLAQRRDRRAVEIVAAALAEDHVGPLVFEAAEYLGDPRLFDSLSKWHEINPHDDGVRRATESCDPEYQRARAERHAQLLTAVEQAFAERGIDTTAYMYCDRGDVDVLLSVTANPDREWIVDRLLEHSRGDIEVAATSVVSAIADGE